MYPEEWALYCKKLDVRVSPQKYTMKRIKLKKEDFDTLISGGVVEKNGYEIILADIGYEYMMKIIKDKWIDKKNFTL